MINIDNIPVCMLSSPQAEVAEEYRWTTWVHHHLSETCSEGFPPLPLAPSWTIWKLDLKRPHQLTILSTGITLYKIDVKRQNVDLMKLFHNCAPWTRFTAAFPADFLCLVGSSLYSLTNNKVALTPLVDVVVDQTKFSTHPIWSKAKNPPVHPLVLLLQLFIGSMVQF